MLHQGHSSDNANATRPVPCRSDVSHLTSGDFRYSNKPSLGGKSERRDDNAALLMRSWGDHVRVLPAAMHAVESMEGPCVEWVLMAAQIDTNSEVGSFGASNTPFAFVLWNGLFLRDTLLHAAKILATTPSECRAA